MDNFSLLRTDSDHPDFKSLVVLLDKDLAIRDGEDHAFYAQYNKIAAIKEVVVAFKDGKAVGCGAFKPFDANSTEIKRMFVHPDFRQQGIAKIILTELESWSKSLDFERCVLETGKKQPEAIALYQKAGYSVIPNYGQYIGIDNSVCLQKILK
ncbi:GNAT family N-acetyltransferase [Pedobacter sp. AW1-32]|uniref:GNAT family N-acetyltransferase n=1 Tax=Pedobacter sp. AW1-32 TaxID=3383026 RepID=UPI003FEEBBFD